MLVAALLIATMGCTLLLLLRMLISGTVTYDFMILNLGLAWIPLFFSTGLVLVHEHTKTKKIFWLKFSLALLWLLFIPNAPYVLTDFIHLKVRDSTPLWFDVLLLESFALTGLLIGTISCFQIEQLMKKKYGKRLSFYISIGTFLLISCGVAIGRFFRFNSWEVFTSPVRLAKELYFSFITPSIWIESIAFSVFFFFFLVGMNLLIKAIETWKRT